MMCKRIKQVVTEAKMDRPQRKDNHTVILFAFSFSEWLSDIVVGLLLFSPGNFHSSLPWSSAWSHDLLKLMKYERKWQYHFQVKHFIMSIFPWLEGHRGASPSLTWKTAARMVCNTCSESVWARNTIFWLRF